MLKSFKVSNFHSIGEEQELSLEIQNKDILDDSAKSVNDKLNLNLVTALVGHNASGKTNILKALTFLFWFVDDSYTSLKPDKRIPIECHKLREDEPVKFEIEFLDDVRLYKYTVEIHNNEVKKEYLGEHIEKGFTRIFEYERSENDWDFKAPKLSVNKQDEDRFKSRRNVSILSSLIDTGYLEIRFFGGNCSNVNQLGYRRKHQLSQFFDVSEKLYKDEDLKSEVLSFVQSIDFGLSGFGFTEAILRNSDSPEEEIKKQVLECVHKTKDQEFRLDLIEESLGTQESFYKLAEILPALNCGGLVVFDEIEDSLHPFVVKKLISLFENKETNPNSAQLIFATHQHLLLNDRTKTQIYLAEKNTDVLETELYRLDDVEGVRNDENYFQKYLAGTYGAVPRIDWL